MIKLTLDGCRLSVKSADNRRLISVAQASSLCVLMGVVILTAACGKKAAPTPRDEVLRKEAEKAVKEGQVAPVDDKAKDNSGNQ